MASDRSWSILQISTRDVGGGAEKIACDLARGFRELGHTSHLAVGYKRGDDPHVSEIPQGDREPPLQGMAWDAYQSFQPFYGRVPGVKAICRFAHDMASPLRRRNRLSGVEDFDYPGSAWVDRLAPSKPDLLHAHNLHGHYFDLRALPELNRRHPMVLTLHDAWLLAGHCAHSFECNRWENGCGACPDLSIYPSVAADATAENWNRKRDIFSQCRLHVATPCAWLMDRVNRSMLAPAVVSSRVIPYGIDLKVFHPGDRRAARQQLGIDADAHVLLFAANGIRQNGFKDYETLKAAVTRVAACKKERPMVCMALGERAHEERIGDAVMAFVPFEKDARRVAQYYRAADVYVHAARADTFPNAVLEALACGTCVVASAVGGIPEQIRSLEIPSVTGDAGGVDIDEATGVLVSGGDAEALAKTIDTLLSSDELRQQLGKNAGVDARHRFDLKRHVRDYLRWYGDILGEWHARAGGAGMNPRQTKDMAALRLAMPPQPLAT